MRFPSLTDAARRARQTAIRFPLALLSGLVAAGVMIALIEGPELDWHSRVWATAMLGLPLFTAIVTTVERRRLSSAVRWIAALVVVAGLVGLGYSSQAWPEEQVALRLLQLALIAHLAVAVAAFARGPERIGFWQWNRILLLRYLLAGVYAGVLFVGLALALAAVDNLFGVTIRNEIYPELWVVLAFVFHPWLMLAGVPEDLEGLDQVEEYPAGLKVFAQFVLLPLVTVYLVILTLYLGKVLVTREWPSGWIGWLVSGVSLTGVLALLLLHPARDREDSTWVNGYGRWFFLALAPSLGILLAAVGKRIAQYGVTEPRYILLVLAVWLLGLGIYYVITGSRNIRPIPVSLGLVAALTWFGPWGAYATSRRSQEGRLDALLVANGMGQLGAATMAGRTVSPEDVKELNGVIRYLHRSHGVPALAAALGLAEDTAEVWAADSTMSRWDRVEVRAARHLGVEYRAAGSGRGEEFTVGVKSPVLAEVAGFDRMQPVTLVENARLEVGATGLVLEGSSDMRTVRISRDSLPVGSFDLSQALDTLGTDGPESLSVPITVDAEVEGVQLRLVLVHVWGQRPEGRRSPTNARGYLLIRRP